MSLATDVKPNEVAELTITGDVAELILRAIQILNQVSNVDAYVLWQSSVSPDAPTSYYIDDASLFMGLIVIDESGRELLAVYVSKRDNEGTVRTRLPLKKAEELLGRIINTVYNYVLISGYLGGGREKIANSYVASRFRDLVETVAPELSVLNPEVYNALKRVPGELASEGAFNVSVSGAISSKDYVDSREEIVRVYGYSHHFYDTVVSFMRGANLVVNASYEPRYFALGVDVRLGGRTNLGSIKLYVILVSPEELMVSIAPERMLRKVEHRWHVSKEFVLSMVPPSVFYYVLNNWCSIALEALERISGTVKDSRLMRNVNLLKVAVEEACKQLQSNTGCATVLTC